jgi:hypothetical protein
MGVKINKSIFSPKHDSLVLVLLTFFTNTIN